MNDWIDFYTVSAIFRPCNGSINNKNFHSYVESIYTFHVCFIFGYLIEQRETSDDCRRNTARWPYVYRSHYEIKCIIPKGRLISNHFIHKWGCTYLKRGKSGCYFATIVQMPYGLRMAELIIIITLNWQVTQGVNMRYRRGSALQLSWGPQKVVRILQMWKRRETKRLYDFFWRSCGMSCSNL